MSTSLHMDGKRKLVCAEEKHFVFQMVLQYKNILENKKTDGVTVEEKKRAWQDIAEAFNSVPEHNKKTVEQIKKIWDNEKTRRKRQFCEEKREYMRTGGGSPTKTIPDDPDVDALLGQVNIELPFALDSDTIVPKTQYEGCLASAEVEEPRFELVLETGEAGTSSSTSKDDSAAEPVPTVVKKMPHSAALKKKVVEKELNIRCIRLRTLMEQDLELHDMRVREMALKLKQEETKQKQEDVRLNQEELKMKQVELKVRQEDFRLKQEELKTKQEQLKVRQEELKVELQELILKQHQQNMN